jgi:hypothetical protein
LELNLSFHPAFKAGLPLAHPPLRDEVKIAQNHSGTHLEGATLPVGPAILVTVMTAFFIILFIPAVPVTAVEAREMVGREGVGLTSLACGGGWLSIVVLLFLLWASRNPEDGRKGECSRGHQTLWCLFETVSWRMMYESYDDELRSPLIVLIERNLGFLVSRARPSVRSIR